MPVLPTSEITANFALWTGAVIYSNYKFYKASEVFSDYEDIYNDFTDGWWCIRRKKDVSDPEWSFITASLEILLPWLVVHIILTEITKLIKCKLTPYLQFTVSVLFLIIHSNPSIILLLLLQPLSFELFSAFKKIWLMWLCCVINLIVITYCKSLDASDFQIYEFDEYKHMLLVAAFYWANLRCISYYSDKINREVSSSYIELLAFIFYLPVLVSGPFISYIDYKGCFTKQGDFKRRLVTLAWKISRIIFWMVFTEAALHFIYVNAMVFQLEYVRKFDAWTLYGYGYAMGQFFHLKYVIFYGLASAFAEFEGASTPCQPKCIGRIHIYSDMWKFFDQGLHKFLLRYIYIPIMKNKSMRSKFLATLFSFVFVYVWHGLEMYILLWTVLNFIGIIMENTSKQIFKKIYTKHEISDAGKRRISCIFAAPFLAVLTINSYSFISGLDIGIIFYTKFFSCSIESLLLVIFLYCCCQVSMEIKCWERHRENLKKHKLQ